MGFTKRHRILVASDGSPSAQAALSAAVKFPWGSASRARAVMGLSDWLRPDSQEARVALERELEAATESARRALSSRWQKAEFVTRNESPLDAIFGEANRFRATVIVLGWRGHGTFRRLLAGSVSRAVAANAKCPVLVVREAPRAIRRFVVGYDGCANAKRAIDLLCSFEVARGSRVQIVNVVRPVSVPASVSLIPAGTRAHIKQEVVALNEERARRGESDLKEAIERLKRCGWSATGELRVGAPLERLLGATNDFRADILVLGARAVSGVERALLGSVANGALNRSNVPVLVVR
ncbi:MAG: universal stress protein [Prosthecobacter sp.]|nr:universal stress protein [Prosthecobacter sp.]